MSSALRVFRVVTGSMASEYFIVHPNIVPFSVPVNLGRRASRNPVAPDGGAAILGALRDQEAVVARGEERASELEHFLVELSTLGVDHAQELAGGFGGRGGDALPRGWGGTP